MKTRITHREPTISITLTKREAVHVGRIMNCGSQCMDFSQDVDCDGKNIVRLEGTEETFSLSLELLAFAGYPKAKSWTDEEFVQLHAEELEELFKGRKRGRK